MPELSTKSRDTCSTCCANSRVGRRTSATGPSPRRSSSFFKVENLLIVIFAKKLTNNFFFQIFLSSDMNHRWKQKCQSFSGPGTGHSDHIHSFQSNRKSNSLDWRWLGESTFSDARHDVLRVTTFFEFFHGTRTLN